MKRRRRRDEWRLQTTLARLLARYIDPSCTFWTSLENKPSSRLNGFLAKLRGVRSGLPDLMFIVHVPAQNVFIELKSRRGIASRNQKQVALELKAKGCFWFMARSAAAALTALKSCGVPFREEWGAGRALAAWEGPFDDPLQRIPQHPEVRARARETAARWRQRRKESGLVAVRPRRAGKVAPTVRREQVREAVRRLRARRRAQGLLPAPPTEAHRARKRAEARRWRARQRALAAAQL